MNTAATGDWQMASTKTFRIAGTSFYRDEHTFRFANGDAKVRMGILKRGGHTAIELGDLPQAMTKAQAVEYLTAQGVKAVVPKTRQGAVVAKAAKAVVVKTAEELAEQKLAAKRAKDAERKRAARAAAKAAKQFIADTETEINHSAF
jgi:hypothetical protein